MKPISQMSDDEKRIAIGLACGWKLYENHNKAIDLYCKPGHRLPGGREAVSWMGIPDYPHSLDACAEFEDALHSDHSNATDYFLNLESIVGKTKHSGTGLGFQVSTARAPQRCNAFLLTMGHPA